MKETITITPSILTWARERAGYKVDELAAKWDPPVDIAGFECGDAKPTYRQIENIADKLQLPVAAFFLPEPPDWPPIEQSFRTLGSEQFAEIPPRIRLLLHKARGFQIGLDELNGGRNPAQRQIVHDLPLHPTTDPVIAAARIRDYLEVSTEEQFSWKSESDALKAWRKSLHTVGVAVFKDAFGDDDFCGFCLYDAEFPLIYVNSSNSYTRQIFTLFHELAHLLFQTSGVDKDTGFRSQLTDDWQRIETLCNRLAAEILVPHEALMRKIDYEKAYKIQAEELSRRYRVSREVILRRILNAGLIKPNQYKATVQQWGSEPRIKRSGGPTFYVKKLAYLGEEYVSLAFERYYEERINDEELAEFLDIKPKHINMMEQTFLGER